MKTQLFKPDFFNDIYRRIMKDGYLSRNAGDMWEPNTRPDDIAKLVNDELDRIIDASPVVYGEYIKDSYGWAMSESNGSGDTHKAVLFNIEELSKEPCKHKPCKRHPPHGSIKAGKLFCKHCGVELVAEWKEKKTL